MCRMGGTTTENSEYCDMTEVELGMVREKAKKHCSSIIKNEEDKDGV